VAVRAGDQIQAEHDLTKAYPFARETNDMPIVALVGVGTAGLAMLLGRTRDAAYMLGAAARLRGGDDFSEPTVAYLVGALEPELGGTFTQAYGEGKSLSIDAALELLDPAGLVEPAIR
jgi:hypothetical protein